MTRALLTSPDRYLKPGKGAELMNRSMRRLVRMGIGVWGARELRVPGRTTGAMRSTVVNLLDVDGERYLVAPRGNTAWVRNLRAAGGGELRVGRHHETFTATELADPDKVDMLRAYLRRWRWEVGQFFDGVGPDATEDELLAIAPGYPVFRLSRRGADAGA